MAVNPEQFFIHYFHLHAIIQFNFYKQITFNSLGFLMIFTIILLLTNAFANDSSIDHFAGNVRFLHNNNIVIRKEILTIGPLGGEDTRFRVEYIMENISKKPEVVKMGFPIPGCSFASYLNGKLSALTSPASDCIFEPQMSLRVDDHAILNGFWSLNIESHGKPITDESKPERYEFITLLQQIPDLELPEAASEITIQNHNKNVANLCKKLGGKISGDGKSFWNTCDRFSQYNVQNIYLWDYTFPPQKKIRIVHEYLANPSTNVTPEEIIRETKNDLFCLSEEPIKTARAQFLKKADPFGEHFVRYLLKPGANWAKGIEEFELHIKKTESMVISTCFKGLQKISPTEFKAVRKNFLPNEDLGIVYFPKN